MATAKGGARPGAGRKAGGTNSVTPDIKAMTRRYANDAVQTVFKIMKSSKFEGNRFAAAKELMDRGFGKPTNVQGGDPDMPTHMTISWEE